MGKSLNGAELVGFIKERQLKQVRNLRQEHRIELRLAIIYSQTAGEVIRTYMRLKERYAADLGVAVELFERSDDQIAQTIGELNADRSYQGLILQLPIGEVARTQQLCDLIAPAKDVDGLGVGAHYVSATAEAIDWLLAGYGVDLGGRKIVIIGDGKLVGHPLMTLWSQRGLDVTVVDDTVEDLASVVRSAEVVVTATGVPNLVKSSWLAAGAVVVDAGTASEGGVLVGDVEASARERQDLMITPVRGGVGPMTVALLFDHLIQAGYRAGASDDPS